MNKLIIGIGNEFRGDDAIGLLVARSLKQKLPYVNIVESNGDITDLLNYFKEYNSIIIIDAAITNDENTIGKVNYIVINKNLPALNIKFYSSHALGVMEAIKIAEQLNLLPDEFHIYGISGTNFNLNQKISERLLEELENVTNLIIKNHFSQEI